MKVVVVNVLRDVLTVLSSGFVIGSSISKIISTSLRLVHKKDVSTILMSKPSVHSVGEVELLRV